MMRYQTMKLRIHQHRCSRHYEGRMGGKEHRRRKDIHRYPAIPPRLTVNKCTDPFPSLGAPFPIECPSIPLRTDEFLLGFSPLFPFGVALSFGVPFAVDFPLGMGFELRFRFEVDFEFEEVSRFSVFPPSSLGIDRSKNPSIT